MAYVFQALEWALNRFPLAPAALVEIDSALRGLEQDDNWQRLLIAERSMVLPVFHNLQDMQRLFKDDSRGLGTSWTAYRLRGNLKRDCNFYLDAIERLEPAADWPTAGRLRQIRTVEIDVEANKALTERRILDVNILSGMFLPSTLKAAERVIRRDALIQLLRTALAVERFRADRGFVPANLAQLVPDYLDALPIDPYTSEPFGYLISPAGCFLNSSIPAWKQSDDPSQAAPWHLQFELRR
jgi:hypothetical protein